jgi:hypothetical protein
VATYGSCFLTCQVISFKKHIKEEFQIKCLKQIRKETKASGLDIFYNFFVLNDLLRNLPVTSNYCEQYIATPRGIRVKPTLNWGVLSREF